MAKKCLLYVEDYPVIQDLFAGVLKQEGFDVDVADDGEKALAQAKKNHYDALLVDILLPGMSGLDFLEKFLKLPNVSVDKTKIIVLSDFDDPAHVARAKALGVKHYWTKVDNAPHELAEKIRQVIKES